MTSKGKSMIFCASKWKMDLLNCSQPGRITWNRNRKKGKFFCVKKKENMKMGELLFWIFTIIMPHMCIPVNSVVLCLGLCYMPTDFEATLASWKLIVWFMISHIYIFYYSSEWASSPIVSWFSCSIRQHQ